MDSKRIRAAFAEEANEAIEIIIPPSVTSTELLSLVRRLRGKFDDNHDFAIIGQTVGSRDRGTDIRIITKPSLVGDLLEIVGNLVETVVPEEEPTQDSFFSRLAKKFGLQRKSSINSIKRFNVTLKEDSMTS